MAIDDMLLDRAAQSPTCCWRFYQWTEPTLSLGYFQPFAQRQSHAASRACAVVRRSTGGGAILHDRELTYSLTVGAEHPLCRSPAELYRQIHGTLIDTLAHFASGSKINDRTAQQPAHDEPFLCFQRRSEGDLVLQGNKICGSAQRRHKGAILQHGSVLLARSQAAPELDGLHETADIDITADELIDCWLPRLSAALDVEFARDELTSTELLAAEHLVAARHAAREWLERR